MERSPALTEEWKAVPGHPGYEISDQGQVRSYRDRQGHLRATPRLMTPKIVKSYLQIKLGRGRENQKKIHFLVLEAFTGPRPDGAQGRHLNGKPLDNRSSNLAWGTPVQNYDDRHNHGTDNTGSRNGRAKLAENDIPKIRQMVGEGQKQRDVAEIFGVTSATINHILNGRTWTHVKEGS